MERRELAEWFHDDVEYDESVMNALKHAGRVELVPDANPTGWRWRRSELGLLALRVCPVDEF